MYIKIHLYTVFNYKTALVMTMPKKKRTRKTKTKKRKKPKEKPEMTRLEHEKIELEEKNKNLLQIIETISKSKEEPETGGVDVMAEDTDKKDANSKTEKDEDKSLSDLKNLDEGIKGGLEEESEEKKEEVPKEDFDKNISKMVNKKIDSKFSKLSEDLEKISNLEDKINKLTEKMTPVPTPQIVGPEAYAPGGQGAGTISKGLAAFSEEVDLQTELNEIKKRINELNKNLDTLKKKTDYSVISISDKIKILDKIPAIEENLQSLSEKLGPDNVQKLRKLIFSADELVDEVVPNLVNKKLRAKMEPAINEIKNVKHNMSIIRKTLEHMKIDILKLDKTKEDIKALELEKDRLYKEIISRDVKFREGVDILKGNVKKKLDSMSDELDAKVDQYQKESHEKIERDINKIFTDVVHMKLAETDRNYVNLTEKIKKLEAVDENLEKKFTELKAPEGVKRWVKDYLKSLNDQTIPEIKSVKKELLEQLEMIKSLKEGIKNLDSFSIHVSKTSETHKEKLDKLNSDERALSDTINELKGEVKVLDEKILMEKERIFGLENDLRTKHTEFSTNLDNQKKEMGDFRLEVVKMIESSMKSLKDDLEQERVEDIKNYTSELRSDILRIQTMKKDMEECKKMHEKGMDKIKTEIIDITPEIKLLQGKIDNFETIANNLSKEKINEAEFSSIVKLITKRIGEIEEHFDGIEEQISKDKMRFDKAMSDLFSDDKFIKSAQELVGKDLSQRLETLRSEVMSLSENLSADKDRLTALEQNLNLIDKQKDSQISTISNDLSKIDEAIIAELEDVKTSMKEIDSMTRSLKEKTVKDTEFVSTTKSMSKRIDEIEAIYTKLDKEMSLDKTKLKVAIEQALTDGKVLKSTQDSLSKWMDEKTQAMSKNIASDMEKLSEQIRASSSTDNKQVYSEMEKLANQASEQAEKISKLNEKTHILKSLTRELPKKLEQQSKELKELMGSSGFLSKRIESIDGSIKSLDTKIDADSGRIMTIEKDLKAHSNMQEKRLDALDSGLAATKGSIQNSTLEIGILKERLDEMEKRFEQSVKTSMEEKNILRDELKKQSNRVARIIKELSE